MPLWKKVLPGKCCLHSQEQAE